MSNGILVGDIGGTHARFAISAGASAPLECIQTLRCADFDHPLAAINHYLGLLHENSAPHLHRICLAVAAPVHKDTVRFTNNDWQFSQRALSRSLNMPLAVLNDFEAQAWCLLNPGNFAWRWLNIPDGFDCLTPSTWPAGLRTIAGPGTGFGAASLSPAGEVICSEPGHIAFAPLDETDVRLLQQLWKWYPRLTIEHLISGPGIANTYCALSCLNGENLTPTQAPLPADIVVMAEYNAVAQQTLQCFSRWMGAVCGDLALAKGSCGGFFLSGGLLSKLGHHFDTGLFMKAFTDKLAFRQWCEAVPVGQITDTWPGLTGCAIHAWKQLENGKVHD